MGAVNWEVEDELGRRTKQSKASNWLILVNYPPVMKSRSRSWQTGGGGGFRKSPGWARWGEHGADGTWKSHVALTSTSQQRWAEHLLPDTLSCDGQTEQKKLMWSRLSCGLTCFFQKAMKITSDNIHSRISTATVRAEKKMSKGKLRVRKAGRQKMHVRA